MKMYKPVSVLLFCFVVLYFVVNLLNGPITSTTYDSLQQEADYEIVAITKERVLEGKSRVDKYSFTVEYTTPDGTQQYTTPLLYGENAIGNTGTLRYGDDGVVLDIETEAASANAIGTLLAACFIGGMFLYFKFKPDR